MIKKMYTSIYIVLITCVLIVDSQSAPKPHKDLTLDYFIQVSRARNCTFPPKTIYSQAGEDKALLQLCNTTISTNSVEACSTFFKVSLQLCMAIIMDSANGTKTMAVKFEPNIIVEASKLESKLCELTEHKDKNISDYATYMNSSIRCEQVCNSNRKMCALLVIALCKMFSSPFCNLPVIKEEKTLSGKTQSPPEIMSTVATKKPASITSTSQSIKLSTTTTASHSEGPAGDSAQLTSEEDQETNAMENEIIISTTTSVSTSVAARVKGGETSTAEKQGNDEDGENKKKTNNSDLDNGVDDSSPDGENDLEPILEIDNDTPNDDTKKNGPTKNGSTKKLIETNDGEKDQDEVVGNNHKSVSSDLDEESHGSGHFIAYFLTAVVICVAGYIIFHNKQKIFAFVIEGRNAHSRRQRSKGVKYTELKSNVEEVMPSLEKTATAKNFVY